MATSGKQFLSATAADIIKEALQVIGVLAEGETVNATTEADCIRTLNYMVKHWQGKHMGNLWAIERMVLFPKKKQREYTISATSTDKFCNYEDFVVTHVKVAATSGAGTIDVDSITNISDNDKIGIQTENNVVEWFDVNGAPSGDTVTFDGGTLSAGAAVNNVVYVYTPVVSTFSRPLQIIHAVSREKNSYVDNTVGLDIPIIVTAREGYFNLSTKSTEGRVNQIYYSPNLGSGQLNVWPTTLDETQHIVMWVRREIEYFDANTQDVDYPQEWYFALSWNLAMNLGPKWGMVDKERYGIISSLAMQYLKEAADNDTEAYMRLRPDFEGI